MNWGKDRSHPHSALLWQKCICWPTLVLFLHHARSCLAKENAVVCYQWSWNIMLGSLYEVGWLVHLSVGLQWEQVILAIGFSFTSQLGKDVHFVEHNVLECLRFGARSPYHWGTIAPRAACSCLSLYTPTKPKKGDQKEHWQSEVQLL